MSINDRNSRDVGAPLGPPVARPPQDRPAASPNQLAAVGPGGIAFREWESQREAEMRQLEARQLIQNEQAGQLEADRLNLVAPAWTAYHGEVGQRAAARAAEAPHQCGVVGAVVGGAALGWSARGSSIDDLVLRVGLGGLLGYVGGRLLGSVAVPLIAPGVRADPVMPVAVERQLREQAGGNPPSWRVEAWRQTWADLSREQNEGSLPNIAGLVRLADAAGALRSATRNGLAERRTRSK